MTTTNVAVADWIKRIADEERRRDTARGREGTMSSHAPK